MCIHCKIIKLGLVSNLTHKVPELKDYLETDGEKDFREHDEQKEKSAERWR